MLAGGAAGRAAGLVRRRAGRCPPLGGPRQQSSQSAEGLGSRRAGMLRAAWAGRRLHPATRRCQGWDMQLGGVRDSVSVASITEPPDVDRWVLFKDPAICLSPPPAAPGPPGRPGQRTIPCLRQHGGFRCLNRGLLGPNFGGHFDLRQHCPFLLRLQWPWPPCRARLASAGDGAGPCVALVSWGLTLAEVPLFVLEIRA